MNKKKPLRRYPRPKPKTGEQTSVQLVGFHGDQLQAVSRMEDGKEKVWVVVRRVCEALGVDESGQRQKLAEKAWACTELISAHDATGRHQAIFCIDIDSLPMWLATMEESRVGPVARPKLIAYQKECARVLRDHFLKPRHPGHEAYDNYRERVLLNEHLPENTFSVLLEVQPMILRAARLGLPCDQHSVPDISVGQCWGKHWVDGELAKQFGERLKFEHHYPSDYPQSKADIEAWVYPIEALSAFRLWLDREYRPKKYPAYLQRKVKEQLLSAPERERLLGGLRKAGELRAPAPTARRA